MWGLSAVRLQGANTAPLLPVGGASGPPAIHRGPPPFPPPFGVGDKGEQRAQGLGADLSAKEAAR